MMFVYFDALSYDQKELGSLVWEPLHYIKYHVDGGLKVIATDALIPEVLRSRLVRLLLTKTAEKFNMVTTPPLAGRRLDPIAEEPEHVLREFQELWHALAFSQATSPSGESISSSDMLKWQLGRMGWSVFRGRKFEFEISQHLGLTISNSAFKDLLETVLGISGDANIDVLERRIVHYPLAVSLGEKPLVRDAVNQFRVDAIYTRCVTSDSRVKKIFENAFSSAVAGI